MAELTVEGHQVWTALDEFGRRRLDGLLEDGTKIVVTGVVSVTVSDSGLGAETVSRPERLMTLLDQATGADVITRPYREMIITDLASCLEAFFKLRELATVTDEAAGLELVTVGVAGVIKTKIFLILGDLAIQLTGD